MIRKGLVVFWWMVFCLFVLVGCKGGGGGSTSEVKKEDSKIEVVPPVTTDTSPITPEAPVTIQLEVVPASKTMKPGDTFTFSGKGGEPPYTYSAKFGAIDSLGLYTFSEGIKEGDVLQITDSKGKVASSIIFGDFSGMWTWVGGSDSVDQKGNYGEKGISSPGNIPGARSGAVSWTDSEGDLWLFGGYGYSSSGYGYLNDLWKFNIDKKEWTFMGGSVSHDQKGTYGSQGVASPDNFPGARANSSFCTDAGGNLWLFGGKNGSPDQQGIKGYFDDIWKFDTTNNQWTWINESKYINSRPSYYSPSNPGGSEGAAIWKDKGDTFWLFGGHGIHSNDFGYGYRKDLWKYEQSKKLWTYSPGINSFSYRAFGGNWKDSGGNFWFFGGTRIVPTGGGGFGRDYYYNDLWKFDTSNNKWTWVVGSGYFGNYGTRGVESSKNFPGARMRAVSVTDLKGNFWLFGGWGYPASANWGHLSDLWKFNTSNNQWTWVAGSDSSRKNGIYGTIGVESSKNSPGARMGAVSWTDSKGNLWLFGGNGFGLSGSGYLNDLWKFTPPKD